MVYLKDKEMFWVFNVGWMWRRIFNICGTNIKILIKDKRKQRGLLGRGCLNPSDQIYY
jgi:hypothetical protein